MADTSADVLIDTLHEWGVEVIFGLPGDGINGIMKALRMRQDKIRFIQVRHEESAAFMACAYAKFTGKLGVCLATSGPGGLHLLNGLYDAKLDGQPVLALTGLPYHDLIGTHTQQDVELDKVFADVAKYNVRVMGAEHVESVAHLACRTALAYNGVSHIAFPVDLQDAPVKNKGSKRNIPGHTSEVFARSARLPAEADLDRAAEILSAGRKVAILVGRGALGAADELEQVADAGAWDAMVRAVRNLDRPGIASMAISAVDNALWDLKAHLLRVPVVTLLGAVRDHIPVYGSGGLTSYTLEPLERQLAGWVADGMSRVKMKVGRDASVIRSESARRGTRSDRQHSSSLTRTASTHRGWRWRKPHASQSAM